MSSTARKPPCCRIATESSAASGGMSSLLLRLVVAGELGGDARELIPRRGGRLHVAPAIEPGPAPVGLVLLEEAVLLGGGDEERLEVGAGRTPAGAGLLERRDVQRHVGDDVDDL